MSGKPNVEMLNRVNNNVKIENDKRLGIYGSGS
jgi:hypothetical protein